jgi:hypothetical protein
MSFSEQELRMIHHMLLDESPCTLDEYAEQWNVDLDSLFERLNRVVPFTEDAP